MKNLIFECLLFRTKDIIVILLGIAMWITIIIILLILSI